ncbi:MAG: bacterial Ig-like domain-containing protein [Prevotella sp.]
MKYLNKISSVMCSAALGLLVLTGCEGGDLYGVTSPDWISEKIDSIENAKKQNQEEEVLEGMEEDVYTVGATDFSTGWWAAFSKYYVIPDGKKFHLQFNLNINPSATNTYKNFAMILSNDFDRGAADYKEYGAIRYDNQPSGNSEWGDYIDRSCVESTLTFNTDTDAGVDKLGGKVTITIDRSDPTAFSVTMSNGTVVKTYKQKSPLANLNPDESNTNMRIFLVPEGSYINFLAANIEPIGGFTSALDKNPISMTLENVPDEVIKGTSLEDAMANVSATVQFEEGVSKVVPAAELLFSAIPDMDQVGEKNLIVIYNKTFKGENAATPIVAYGTFKVVDEIASIEVTELPIRDYYTFYTSEATKGMTDRTLAFDPTGMVVTATYTDGTKDVVNNSKLTFSPVPARAGDHKVTISTANGKTAEVEVTVGESKATQVSITPTVLGAEDNTSGWWSMHTNDVKVPAGETYVAKFTNYSSLGANWNNFVVVLRKANLAEYAVVRADNHGWGAGYDGNANLVTSGGQPDWATWLAAMNGAKVELYVTNCNNGTADIQAVMHGTDGNDYIQYYLGISTVDPNDCGFAFTVDGCHMVFE